jgi:hypothetical protein
VHHKLQCHHEDEIYPEPAEIQGSCLKAHFDKSRPLLLSGLYYHRSQSVHGHPILSTQIQDQSNRLTSPTTRAHFLNGFLDESPSSCIANLQPKCRQCTFSIFNPGSKPQ